MAWRHCGATYLGRADKALSENAQAILHGPCGMGCDSTRTTHFVHPRCGAWYAGERHVEHFEARGCAFEAQVCRSYLEAKSARSSPCFRLDIMYEQRCRRTAADGDGVLALRLLLLLLLLRVRSALVRAKDARLQAHIA